MSPTSRRHSWEERLANVAVLNGLDFTKPIPANTPPWYHARRGRITASTRGRVIAERKAPAWASLINEIEAELSPNWQRREFDNDAMKWGRDHEEEAVFNAELELGGETTNPGLILHPNYVYAGATPDAFFGDDTTIQIKCPYNPDNHLKFLYDQRLDIIAPQYYYQVNFEAWVSGRPKIVFMSYDPRQPAATRCALIRLDANQKLWQIFTENLAEFYRQFHLDSSPASGKISAETGIPSIF